ncbi:PilZ domain-containing protein [Desulfurivibrio sp. D14AmB]|uniref:PilZ domain-containing protein n=1 Tax=Desulfurivibrio sp. D14AmB TaxID=3374370 RepID=UPI00376EED10
MEKSGGRRLTRRNLIYHLEVFDEESGELVGRLVDITTEGVKLVASSPVGPDRHFRLRMKLPEDHFPRSHWCFEAVSLWTTRDINPEFHTTGFRLVKLDEADQELVSGLIELFSFND